MLLRTSPAAVLALLAATAAASLTGCGPQGVLGPVEVPAGATAEGATTINAPVTIGEGAKVGEAATVNGPLRLGAHATVNSARTVNGGVDIGEGARVLQDIDVVNGSVRLAKGADVGGTLKNVNGSIHIESAHVARGISTYTGDIEIGSDSRVEGGIHVQKPDFDNDHNRTPRVIIGSGSVVEGTLKFDRDVKLLVSDGAKIGPVEGATAQLFAGDDPNHIIVPPAADAASTDAPPADEPAAKPADKPAAKAAPGAGAAQKQ
jgi:UDP-3-O-[3-hydroxymyristoyl] glucosamine N-acyltransferase